MIKIFLADDHIMFREGLKRIFSETKDISVVGEAGSGTELIDTIGDSGADILLLDISMPGPTFLELLNQLKTYRTTLRILVLTDESEQQYAVRAFRAGASGFLAKSNSHNELIDAVRKVNEGTKYASQSFLDALVTALDNDHGELPHESLSDREYEVLRLLGDGNKIQEIADKLSISPKTASTYRARILKKMNLKNNVDIVRYLIEHKLAL